MRTLCALVLTTLTALVAGVLVALVPTPAGAHEERYDNATGHGLVVPGPPRHSAGPRPVVGEPDLQQQRELLHALRRQGRLREADPRARLHGGCRLPGGADPGGHRGADRGRQRQLDRQQLHLRQLALRDDAVLGACPLRDEYDPSKLYDTSNHNRTIGNTLGITPKGVVRPNGMDHWWDDQGDGNRWGNTPSYGEPTHNVVIPPASCADGGSVFTPGLTVKDAGFLSCSQYDRNDPTWRHPPECEWFDDPRTGRGPRRCDPADLRDRDAPARRPDAGTPPRHGSADPRTLTCAATCSPCSAPCSW